MGSRRKNNIQTKETNSRDKITGIEHPLGRVAEWYGARLWILSDI